MIDILQFPFKSNVLFYFIDACTIPPIILMASIWSRVICIANQTSLYSYLRLNSNPDMYSSQTQMASIYTSR